AMAGVALAVGAYTASAAKTHAGATFRVALLNPGTKNDGSWGQAVDQGAVNGAKAVGGQASLVDLLETPAQYQQQGAAYAKKGYDLVIVANGSDPQVVTALAKQFPKTWFCEVAATIANPPKNVCTINLTYYDGDFLAGALAGMVSKTGHVGEIGGGADVIFSATDQATQGIYAAAQAKGNTYAISQYFDTHSQAPSVVLTSVVFGLPQAIA